MQNRKKNYGKYNIKDSRNNRNVLDKLKSRKKKKVNEVDPVVSKYSKITAEEASTFRKFSQYPLSPQTLLGLEDSGFTEPTDIQRQSIFHSIIGEDVVGAAKTGSGKTIALLLPVLECLWRNKWSKESGLGALIISPTRELAYQIFQVLNEIGRHHNFSAGVLIGGTDVEYEINRLCVMNILVCTPGRLLQHMDENASFYCDSLQILAIDEADRLLEMGFAKQMDAIVTNLPFERQTILFSATQTRNVKDLVRVCTNDPTFVFAHEYDEIVTPENLQQFYFICEEQEKINMLWSYLISHKRKKTLIFVTCCKQARFLTSVLCSLRPGLSLLGIWGTMNQQKRMEVYESFHAKGKGAALIATDVASRGLDFKNVDYVLQLDCPSTVEDYIHRVGRTARMNKKGEAVLALTPSQEKRFLTRLNSQGIIPSKIEIDAKMMVDIRSKLSAMLAERAEYKDFAQKSIVAFAKAYHSMRLKDVFDVSTINFEALSLSYGLAIAPRIRFLKKRGIEINRTKESEKSAEIKEGNIVKDDTDNKDHVTTNSYEFNVADDDDDFLKISKKNVFNIDPNEKMNELLIPQSKKKTMAMSKEKLGKKLLKRGALILNKKIVYDDDGNVIVDTHEPSKFDYEETQQKFTEMNKQIKREHRETMKKIKREKLVKLTNAKKREKEIDFADTDEEDDNGVDLSWLPDPDAPKHYEDDDEEANDYKNEDDYEEPMAKKMKIINIEDAEAKALSLLNV